MQEEGRDDVHGYFFERFEDTRNSLFTMTQEERRNTDNSQLKVKD